MFGFGTGFKQSLHTQQIVNNKTASNLQYALHDAFVEGR